MPRLFLSLLLSLGIASSASAVTMDWTFVGNPGNALDNTGYGAVDHAYQIGTYEVTNAQYTEFLNAVARNDTFGLYYPGGSGFKRIVRTQGPTTVSYSVMAGYENAPVSFVSYFDAMRFANWMHNGQPTGAQDATTTEDGAYTLNGVRQPPGVVRNPGAITALPSEDEWYKAAYYDAASASYYNFPAGTDTPTTCSAPSSAPNRANCGAAIGGVGDLVPVGSYPGSMSPSGTFDQGGNVNEWNEAIIALSSAPPIEGRGVRGGTFQSPAAYLGVTEGAYDYVVQELDNRGFRLMMIPEPGTSLLVFAGLLGLAGWRRARE